MDLLLTRRALRAQTSAASVSLCSASHWLHKELQTCVSDWCVICPHSQKLRQQIPAGLCGVVDLIICVWIKNVLFICFTALSVHCSLSLFTVKLFWSLLLFGAEDHRPTHNRILLWREKWFVYHPKWFRSALNWNGLLLGSCYTLSASFIKNLACSFSKILRNFFFKKDQKHDPVGVMIMIT